MNSMIQECGKRFAKFLATFPFSDFELVDFVGDVPFLRYIIDHPKEAEKAESIQSGQLIKSVIWGVETSFHSDACYSSEIICWCIIGVGMTGSMTSLSFGRFREKISSPETFMHDHGQIIDNDTFGRTK